MKGTYSLLSLGLALLIHLGATAQYKENDWEDRDQWMRLPQIFQLAEIGNGDTVADVGCHEGYLSIRLSKKVGEEGQVYAVDVRQDRLNNLKENLKKRKLNNVEVVLGDYDNPQLPKNKLDVVFVIDTYHEMDDYMTILTHIKASLKAGGRIVLLEKLKQQMKGKSREQQTGAHTLSMGYVKKELKAAGFTISKEVKDLGVWNHEKNKKMWVLVATK
ncbi:class I SAM-dependent methyltransferase [Flavobacteriaceae bacterium 3-367]|uniref:class I SAM-dependent methyltransferase n=1 Tax=Eudoraea algarum TaxID=3417568 RepID=UPI00326FD478